MLTGHYDKIQDSLSSPSPIAWIKVSNPYSSKNEVKNIKAILDTGAGKTCIPQSIIKELGSSVYTTIKVRSPLDRNITTSIRLYSVTIEFDGQENEVEVIGISEDYAIIGRDILNQYKITLNGPEETWSIE